MKIVLDTNVLISGIFFSGPPSRILKAWQIGDVQLVLSEKIIDEYFKVAEVLSDDLPGIETKRLLTLIVTHSDIIQTSPFPKQICEDPDDDKFLACALSGESKIIVSGDKHLLRLSGYRGITVLTPRLFVEQYLKK